MLNWYQDNLLATSARGRTLRCAADRKTGPTTSSNAAGQTKAATGANAAGCPGQTDRNAGQAKLAIDNAGGIRARTADINRDEPDDDNRYEDVYEAAAGRTANSQYAPRGEKASGHGRAV